MDNSLDRLEILQDKSLPITVKLLTLCPTKDLVAVVLSDSEVAVYRVLWQKVSSFVIPFGSSNVTVTALEWSPDGNLIAVGRSDGKLDIFRLESEDDSCCLEQTIFPNKDAVAYLYWVDLEKDMNCADSRYQELIQRERKEYIRKRVLDKIPFAPSVLWLSSCGGCIRALMHGRVPLWQLYIGEQSTVSDLYFSKHGYLFYACHSTAFSVTLHALSFDRFQSLWGPFSWFAENILQLEDSMECFQSYFQNVLSTLKEIGQLVIEKWNILQGMLKDYDENVSNVRDAFLSLINGRLLSVFTPFFVTEITWMGAERWKKQIQDKISHSLMSFMNQLSLEIRQMWMRWSRLESFFHHQREQQPEILDGMYSPCLEWKQKIVDLWYRWNTWKQHMEIYVERLSSFVDWFCYHTHRLCRESGGCLETTPIADAFPMKKLLQVILFLDDTPEEWFSPSQDWMDLGIDDWKLPFECYSRGLEKLDCISRDPMVWSFAWSSDECLSNRITYQDRMDSNAGITIAYTEAQQMKCLWLSTQRKELSLVAQFTIPIDNCIVKTIMWWSPEYLLWCAIPKQHHPAMGITIGMSQMTTLSQSNTTQVATYSIPLDNLNYSIELSSSPHRNLIGIQIDSKRIVLLEAIQKE